MSRTYATPLEVEINTSRSLIWLVLLITVIAVVCVILLSVEVIVKLLACLVIAVAGYFAVAKNNQYRQLIWYEDNHWMVKSDISDVKAVLLPDSYVSPWLTILCFRTDDSKKLSVMIFPDAINPEQFRRLRGRLTIDRTKLFSNRHDSL